MARTLLLPDRMAPSNLHLRDSVRTRFVTSDQFDIANRLKALSPNLYVLELSEGDKYAYNIMETAKDGTEMLVLQVKELDGRVLDRLRYLMAVPLQQRLAILDAEGRKYEADAKEAELEELYETLGGPMAAQLYHDGFTTTRPTSYAKSGVTGGRGSRAKS